MLKNLKGREREKSLERSAYLNDDYFDLRQLCTYAHQISDIYSLKPTKILEVGIGNGFTSLFLKNAGYEVTTADINCNLMPDVCCAIDELKNELGTERYDLVVCCEVLEHLPFGDFEKALSIFSDLGSSLYLTLPNYKRVFGFGGFVKILPKKPFKLKEFMFEIPNTKKMDYEHFWEVGSSKQTTKGNIIKLLKQFYTNVDCKRYTLNSYHMAFIANP